MNGLRNEFGRRFSREPENIYFCPGRINLIGEHIDYNGGKVMPCAISRGSYLAVGGNTSKQLRFRSLNFSDQADLHVQQSYSRSGKTWFNYPLGVINMIIAAGKNVSGLDMLFSGDLPVAAGLSSSASIEVVMAFACNDIFGLGLSGTEIAILSKKAENEFIGVDCGIMDQFAVSNGKKDHAVLLDCSTLEYEYLPLHTGNYDLVIINTNKPRELADSKYNERFAECQSALKMLRKTMNIDHLCDLTPGEFQRNRGLVETEVLRNRVWHVVTENARVQDAADALRRNDLVQFGELMFVSHESLRHFYEVTGRELDTIIDFCKDEEACIGARMTGAGFGGCAIALMEKKTVADFSNRLKKHYSDVIGYAPDIFIAEIADGVRAI